MKLWYVCDALPSNEWIVAAATAEEAVVIAAGEYVDPERLTAKEIALDDKPTILLYSHECI